MSRRRPSAASRPRRSGPVERVRRRLREELGSDLAGRVPAGYQRVGDVVIVRLPEELTAHRERVGQAYLEMFPATAVLRVAGPVAGEERRPRMERIAGASTEVTVVEHGISYKFDAATVLFSRGNRTERHRAGALTQPGEIVADLFAGIGYFLLPALLDGNAAHGVGCELREESYRYLVENLALNEVADRATAHLGDNRSAPLPRASFDRVFLGYLPSSEPWIPLAVSLVRPSGGWLHIHLVADVRRSLADVAREVAGTLANLGADGGESRARDVKSYGPGRRHVVVDAFVRSGGAARGPPP